MGEMQGVQVGKPRISLETRLYQWLGQHDGFYTHPPLDHRKLYICEGQEVVSLNNDGFEVWIGRLDKWHWHTNTKEFRQICFWYLRQWVFVDWFGLRSWLWYKLLHRQCRTMTKPAETGGWDG